MKKKKLLSISFMCLLGMIIVGCGGVNGGGGTSNPTDSSSSSALNSDSSSQAPSSSQTTSSSEAGPVAPTGVTLNQQSVSILKGQKETLVATVAPENAANKDLVWSVDDSDVISVTQQGVVTALEVGNANVKVKVKNTNLEATCAVSVIKQINSVTIANKASFDGFAVHDIETLNVSVNPADNTAQLIAAGVLKTSSSDPTVASAEGLNIVGLKAGKTTIKVELFGKEDSFELTVNAEVPGMPYTIKNALDEAYSNAKPNGQSGNKANIYGPKDGTTSKSFEFGPAKVLAVAPDYDSSTKAYSDTGYIALIDDGTAPLYLLVGKEKEQPIPIAEGDYIKVTCRLTNYFGLFEGIARNAETNKRAPYIFYQDVVKLDAPETPINASIATAEAMTAEQYKAYYEDCKNQSKTSTSTAYVQIKHVSISAKFDAARNETDKGGYLLYEDPANAANNLGLQNLGLYQLDEAPDGHISQLEVYLIGANTSKSKSNGFIMNQTHEEPTAIRINQAADTIVVHGNTLQMTYATTPTGSYTTGKVSWASSDETVATVDDSGLLTGIYVGDGSKSANITVTLGEGESAIVSEPVSIKVFGEEVPVTSAELNKSELALTVGQSEKLIATPTPEKNSDNAVWSSSAAAVASVDQEGNVKALKAGTANITVKYNANVSKTCVVTVSNLDAAHNYVGAKFDTVGVLVAKQSNNKTLMIDDGTGGLYTYASKEVTQNIGDIVKVSGTTKNYKGGIEIDSATVEAAPEGTTVTPATAQAITPAEVKSLIDAHVADSSYAVINRKVSLRTGVIGGSGYYLTWSYGDALMETGISTGNMEVGKIYDIEGYFVNFFDSGDSHYICICITKATLVDVQATAIALNKEELSLEEGNNETLVATLSPEGASATISWKSSDETKATVDANGKVSAVAEGSATITAFIDANGNSQFDEGELNASCAVTITAAQGGGGGGEQVEAFVVDFSAKTANHNKYGDTWTYGDVTVSGGANNNGGWAFVKMGGKSETISAADYPGTYIKTDKAISYSVASVTIKFVGKCYNQESEKATVKVESYSDAALATKVAETPAQEVPAITTNEGVEEMTFTFTTAQAANMYFKINFDIINTTTYNGVVALEKITFNPAN